jgi:restriction system protein
MAKQSGRVSKTSAIAIKTLHTALVILKENGGEMRGRDVLAEMERRVPFDEQEKSIYAKTGYVRWRSIFHFYSIDLIKAGFLLKKKGTWYLTPEGDKAIALGPQGVLETSVRAYRAWREQNPIQKEAVETTTEEDDELEGDAPAQAEMTVEEMQIQAREGIQAFINAKNGYEFQDLCAALLRGMGYYTPFVAPKGRDGGIDIMAYRDPLGTVAPRIRVQVKHRENSATDPEIHQLLGTLRGDGDVGIFISSGGFTSTAKSVARNSRIHIELIDLERFIELWQQFYQKLSDEDKILLPLLPVYFLAPSE